MNNCKSAAELLLCCARTQTGEIDWEYLFLLARRHSIVPLVYFQLERSAPDIVPAPILKKLKQHYIENSARNTILTTELCRLITRLADSGIEAIPYKGPVLAQFAYGNIALR